MAFDFGAAPSESGGNIKQASEGQHEARLLGIVHLGMYADTFNGETKPPAPFVCALFELKSGEEGGGVNADGKPIIVHRSFPLKKGDRAFLTKFMKVMLSSEEFKQYNAGILEGGFEDFVGRACLIDMKGSKVKDDNGDPKYTNVSEISAMPPKFAKLCEELEGEPVGHVTLDDMNEDALRAIPPFEIYGKMEFSKNFPGSKAEEVLEEIREEDPEFAVKSDKADDKGGSKEASNEAPKAPEKQRDDLNEDEDFS